MIYIPGTEPNKCIVMIDSISNPECMISNPNPIPTCEPKMSLIRYAFRLTQN